MENLIVKYYGTNSAADENFDVYTLPKQNSLSEEHNKNSIFRLNFTGCCENPNVFLSSVFHTKNTISTKSKWFSNKSETPPYHRRGYNYRDEWFLGFNFSLGFKL